MSDWSYILFKKCRNYHENCIIAFIFLFVVARCNVVKSRDLEQ